MVTIDRFCCLLNLNFLKGPEHEIFIPKIVTQSLRVQVHDLKTEINIFFCLGLIRDFEFLAYARCRSACA